MPLDIISLTYIIGKNESNHVTMDVFQAERYESALIIQQLVGTLVYYSNQGQYKPRLAKSWYPGQKNDWIFELKDNLLCENNEIITAKSYKESLERTIKILGKDGLPLFDKLIGFEDFISEKNSHLAGLIEDNNKIIFQFTEKITSGLVQMLSFSPFGYISSGNLNQDCTWKDPKRFYSSGPYKIKSIKLGEEYIITKNEKWSLERESTSPDQVQFIFSQGNNIPKKTTNFIVDIVRWKNLFSKQLYKFSMVPEYLNAILLGNLETGFLSSIQNREYLRYLINNEKNKITWQLENFTFSDTFYPNQANMQLSPPGRFEFDTKNFKKEVIIQGTEPNGVSGAHVMWKLLKNILVDNHISYKFNGKTSWKDASDNSIDIRMSQLSIGQEMEVWGLNILFSSELGNRLPDPSNAICKLIKKCEKQEIEFEDFKKQFFDNISKDSALLPICHSGTELFLSEGIDTTSITPTLNIIKFDQLKTK